MQSRLEPRRAVGGVGRSSAVFFACRCSRGIQRARSREFTNLKIFICKGRKNIRAGRPGVSLRCRGAYNKTQYPRIFLSCIFNDFLGDSAAGGGFFTLGIKLSEAYFRCFRGIIITFNSTLFKILYCTQTNFFFFSFFR